MRKIKSSFIFMKFHCIFIINFSCFFFWIIIAYIIFISIYHNKGLPSFSFSWYTSKSTSPIKIFFYSFFILFYFLAFIFNLFNWKYFIFLNFWIFFIYFIFFFISFSFFINKIIFYVIWFIPYIIILKRMKIIKKKREIYWRIYF